jgi:hypothetical protein
MWPRAELGPIARPRARPCGPPRRSSLWKSKHLAATGSVEDRRTALSAPPALEAPGRTRSAHRDPGDARTRVDRRCRSPSGLAYAATDAHPITRPGQFPQRVPDSPVLRSPREPNDPLTRRRFRWWTHAGVLPVPRRLSPGGTVGATWHAIGVLASAAAVEKQRRRRRRSYRREGALSTCAGAGRPEGEQMRSLSRRSVSSGFRRSSRWRC